MGEEIKIFLEDNTEAVPDEADVAEEDLNPVQDDTEVVQGEADVANEATKEEDYED